jgi:hypothetical protein
VLCHDVSLLFRLRPNSLIRLPPVHGWLERQQ